MTQHFIEQPAKQIAVPKTAVPIFGKGGEVPGHAAYFGLLHIAKLKAGEIVFVSSAAGAVGSVVAQIAKLKGYRVIGSAGSEAKAQGLREDLGLDAVINYNVVPDLEAALRRAAPEGIDVFLTTSVALTWKRLSPSRITLPVSRFPLCGMVGQYNGTPTGPSNIYTVIAKSLQLQGFIGIIWIPGLNSPET